MFFFWGGEPKEFCKGFIMDPFRRAIRRFWGSIFRRFLMLWMVGDWQMCTWDMNHDHCMLIGSYPRLHDVVHNCNVLGWRVSLGYWVVSMNIQWSTEWFIRFAGINFKLCLLTVFACFHGSKIQLEILPKHVWVIFCSDWCWAQDHSNFVHYINSPDRYLRTVSRRCGGKRVTLSPLRPQTYKRLIGWE